MSIVVAPLLILWLFGILVSPIYVAFEVGKVVRERRRTLTRRRELAGFELREQYAAGMLTLVGLEERLDATHRASSHFEVDSVLADLPPRRKPPLPVAVFETLAGVAVLLAFHGFLARGTGAALVVGALVPPTRWRPVASAFLAGFALLVAPIAALAFAVSAVWRFARPTA